MKIKKYEEKEIRKAILNKVNPRGINKNSKHWKGFIYIGEKVEAKVKIPNNHKRDMEQSKSKYIACDLKLDYSEFNDLVDCTLNEKGYYEKLKKAVS